MKVYDITKSDMGLIYAPWLRITNTLTPIIITSAMGFDGRGIPIHKWLNPIYYLLTRKLHKTRTAIIGKTFTLHKQEGDFRWWKPWQTIKRYKGGLINSFGLRNKGVNYYADKITKSLLSSINIIPSFAVMLPEPEDAINEALEIISIINLALPFSNVNLIVEFNASCPNTNHNQLESVILDIVKEIRNKYPNIKLIVKLSPDHSLELIKNLSDYVYALHTFNSVKFNWLYPNKKSPLRKYGGAVSGAPIKEFVLHKLKEVGRLLEDKNCKVIMGGGVSEIDDIWKYRERKADFVSICTLAIRKPNETRQIVKRYNGVERRGL